MTTMLAAISRRRLHAPAQVFTSRSTTRASPKAPNHALRALAWPGVAEQPVLPRGEVLVDQDELSGQVQRPSRGGLAHQVVTEEPAADVRLQQGGPGASKDR